MPDWLLTLLVVGGATLVSVAGLHIVRRNLSLEQLRPNNEVGGFIHAAVGVIYAIIVAFVVVVVWEEYSEAEAGVRREAGEIADMYHDAELLPDTVRLPLQSAIRKYAQSIIEDEWPLLNEQRESDATSDAYRTVHKTATHFKPEGYYEQSIFMMMLNDLDRVTTERRERLLNSEESIPGLMWLLLIGGGIITVVFAFMFGAESVFAHAFMIAALAAILAMALFLIAALDHPFSGVIHVDVDPFIHLMKGLE
jgi:hypothetical protein